MNTFFVFTFLKGKFAHDFLVSLKKSEKKGGSSVMIIDNTTININIYILYNNINR